MLYEKQNGAPKLRGQRCRRCGRLAFPPNPYGCENCGGTGDALEPKLLAGRGRILAFVKVNRAVRPNVSVPYVVGSIALDDGPVIRALMNTAHDTQLQVNDTVEAELVFSANPEDDAPQLRFRRQENV